MQSLINSFDHLVQISTKFSVGSGVLIGHRLFTVKHVVAELSVGDVLDIVVDRHATPFRITKWLINVCGDGIVALEIEPTMDVPSSNKLVKRTIMDVRHLLGAPSSP